MPYKRDIWDIRDDIRDEGITSSVALSVVTFTAAAALIWFIIATH